MDGDGWIIMFGGGASLSLSLWLGLFVTGWAGTAFIMSCMSNSSQHCLNCRFLYVSPYVVVLGGPTYSHGDSD